MDWGMGQHCLLNALASWQGDHLTSTMTKQHTCLDGGASSPHCMHEENPKPSPESPQLTPGSV